LSDADRELQRKLLGRIGEAAAIRALRQAGYRILETNAIYTGGEIDIIAEHNDVVVFVEVKTRSPRAWGEPEAAVDEAKQARIVRAGQNYLAQFGRQPLTRFDIVAVRTDGHNRVESVRIIPGAFEIPDWRT